MKTPILDETPVTAFVYALVIWLGYVYLFMLMKSSFNKNKYHDKIQNLLFFWYVSEVLAGRPWTEIRHTVKKVLAWKRVQKGLTLKIRTESEAKLVGKKLFETVTRPGSKFIELEDLARFLPEKDALAALSIVRSKGEANRIGVFDVESECEANRISCSSLQDWMVYSFRLERSLALSMDDTDSIIRSARISMYLVGGITQVVALIPILLDVDGKGYALYFFVIFVVFQPIRTTLEAISFFDCVKFFLFGHSYYVGERCELDNIELVVEKINFTTTTFVGLDNEGYEASNRTLFRKSFVSYGAFSRLEKIELILSGSDGKRLAPRQISNHWI